ncbi:hypothetical protein IYR97_24110 (plasmid) [Pseudomonas fulva]|uniref:Uncharacterized protein n=3 Tax=Pseudomonas TaxID=286 RepID=A0A1X1A5T0_PSEPU|nr:MULTISPECIES: hypothetical protein [Pseudomonas]MCT8164124.1 hypothetical protein [Pseudomonas sp. HD6422]MCT8182888.1 hypothetical protein [Pseudomonas sp. HD6421]MDH1932657.1 hypothetical protein [Pseudomonas sp. GD03696]MDM1711844.1 hypothetical protein [Pseudomonas sp. 165]ORL53143.1 hypothetical protein B7H18_03935 [Pseudomonas putida]
MGKLIFCIPMILALTAAAHAEGITQEHKDAIREHYEKLILGSGQDLTVRQPDVALYRRIFTKPNVVDTRPLPPPDQIPWPQIFKTQNLTLGEILNLASAASGYETAFDPEIDQSQVVLLNTAPNSLRDIAEYLTRVSSAQIIVYPEARLITATQKVPTNG